MVTAEIVYRDATEHLGTAANMFCRLCEVLCKLTLNVPCMYFLQAGKLRGTHHMLCVTQERWREACMLQMAVICSQPLRRNV